MDHGGVGPYELGMEHCEKFEISETSVNRGPEKSDQNVLSYFGYLVKGAMERFSSTKSNRSKYWENICHEGA